MTERDIAEQIASGVLPSPQTFMQNAFFALRISGTGVAWRPSIEEFVFRDEDVWLAPRMCQRVCGLIVLSEHPDKAAMDGKEFYRRVIGVVIFGYVRGDELWGICRVVDKRAATILDSNEFDTSPAVLFEPGTNSTISLDDGSRLLVEGNPAFLDHLALIDKSAGNAGVWSKGNDDAIGVATSQNEEMVQ